SLNESVFAAVYNHVGQGFDQIDLRFPAHSSLNMIFSLNRECLLPKFRLNLYPYPSFAQKELRRKIVLDVEFVWISSKKHLLKAIDYKVFLLPIFAKHF